MTSPKSQPRKGAPKPPPTRERILTGAREAFYEKGFFGASVEEIAARAKVSRATVYLHFKSKDEMLCDLLKEDLDVQLDVYRQLAALKRFSLAGVKSWLADFCGYMAAQKNSLDLFWAAAAGEAGREDIANPHRDNVIAILGRRFEGFDVDALARPAREARRVQCHMMIYLIEGVAMSLSQGAAAPDRRTATDQLAAMMFDFLRGGDLRAEKA